MKKTRYKEIQDLLKEKIQQGIYEVGDFLPSEHELCDAHSITRTTVRKALDELVNEGYIEKQHGKGSRVRERRQSLGLLNVKGFSEAAGGNVTTIFLQKPDIRKWGNEIVFPVSNEEKQESCIHFERLRCVSENPVMLENNWFSGKGLDEFCDTTFVDGSFFKTLSQKYLIEIKGSEQELRAEYADERAAYLLKVKNHSPVLHISLKFHTSNPHLNIYAELYCNTGKYPIGNSYYI